MAKQEIRNVTFSPEQLQAVIAQAIAEHEASKSQKVNVDSSVDMEKATVRAFARAGYKSVTPRVDAKTYNLWLAEGRRVKEGEKSIRVRHLRLFHRDQTEELTAVEKKQALADLEAKRSARTADKLPKVSPIEQVNPVQAQPAPAPAKAPRKGAKILITSGGNA